MKIDLAMLIICLPLFLLPSYASANKNAVNGFDQICQIYTQVLTDPSSKSRTKDEKMALIYKKIHKTVTSKSALEAFDSFMAANPKTRYRMLKKIAEHKLKRSWNCSIINTFNY